MQEINVDCKRKRLKFRRFQFSEETEDLSWLDTISE